MPEIIGLSGLRPTPANVATVTAPPYDVIKPGTPLEKLLLGRSDSIAQVTIGADPVAALARLRAAGALVEDAEPCFYVYEQTWAGGKRDGVLAAVAISDYRQKQIIRHEKTFDDKVQGRIRLAKTIGFTPEPIFLLSPVSLTTVIAAAKAEGAPFFAFTSALVPESDLHGLASRIWRVPATSPTGRALAATVRDQRLYIADGHHRYHAALLGGQTHTEAYITDGARITAYNRLITGRTRFAAIRDRLALTPAPAFTTPAKHEFRLYAGGKAWTLQAQTVPADPVGRLDCSILERELYPLLGLDHSMIMDPKHFDYYAEHELATMMKRVDAGDHDLAVALAPVSTDELMAVADAGLDDPRIVMPEKSTFFAPKILSGICVYRHQYR